MEGGRYMNNEAEIAEIAYDLWVKSGQPNGEEYIKGLTEPIKLKDMHWKTAKIIYENQKALEEKCIEMTNTLNTLQTLELVDYLGRNSDGTFTYYDGLSMRTQPIC